MFINSSPVYNGVIILRKFLVYNKNPFEGPLGASNKRNPGSLPLQHLSIESKATMKVKNRLCPLFFIQETYAMLIKCEQTESSLSGGERPRYKGAGGQVGGVREVGKERSRHSFTCRDQHQQNIWKERLPWSSRNF